MPKITINTQHSVQSAKAQAPFPAHDKWVKLSNGCVVSKFITVGELLSMVSFAEMQNTIKLLLTTEKV